jgi:ABC-type multidrug transport system fused ATPase/permease subunit
MGSEHLNKQLIRSLGFMRRYALLAASAVLAVLATVAADLAAPQLPSGFDTQVGERGGALSGGQRQLVAIARALLTDPAILILDEATSPVDTRTDLAIQAGLREILRGRSAFVIAHRLSTVREAHRIIVIESGRITEDGTYAKLLAAGGLFSRLHAAQFESAR